MLADTIGHHRIGSGMIETCRSGQAMSIEFMQSCGDVCCGVNRLNQESGMASFRLAVV